MSALEKIKYFFIDFTTLNKVDDVFDFDLYLFQPVSGSFILDLHKKSPLTQEKIEYLLKVIHSGAKIAVALESMRAYLDHTGLQREDIPGLDVTKHPLYQLMMAHQAEYKEYLETPFNFLEELREVVKTDNFESIIKRTKAELCQFPFTQSPTQSLAHQLAANYLNDEKIMNKTVSLCYVFSRMLGIEDKEELASIVVACFYRDIGISQVSYKQFINENPNDNLEKGFQKHPALSLFLLNKSNLKLEAKVMKIVMDHHELFNGKGYPANKKAQALDLSPQIVGLADHIVSFASGQLVEAKSPYKKVFKGIAKATEMTGMIHGYHPSLIDLIVKVMMGLD